MVFVDNGRIVAHGEHEELLATCSLYKEFIDNAMVRERGEMDDIEILGYGSMTICLQSLSRISPCWTIRTWKEE